MTYNELKQQADLLQRIADNRWNDDHDLRPISDYIRRRAVSIGVSDRGTLLVRLTKRGTETLESAKALLGAS